MALLHEERVTGTPFDTAGVTRGPDGIKRYDRLPGSLAHMLRDTVEGHPDREALAEAGRGRRRTYHELWDRAARVAGGLRAAGLQHGDRVALRLGNGVDWALAFFGAVLAGATVVPVNTRLTEDEVAYVVTDSGASYVIAPGDPLSDGPPLAVDGTGPDDPAAIFYTSGTAGFLRAPSPRMRTSCQTARTAGGSPAPPSMSRRCSATWTSGSPTSRFPSTSSSDPIRCPATQAGNCSNARYATKPSGAPPSANRVVGPGPQA